MTSVKGYVDRIVFRNEENGYTVLSLEFEDKNLTIVGNFNYINEGEYISAEGEIKLHPSYGEQLLERAGKIIRSKRYKRSYGYVYR